MLVQKNNDNNKTKTKKFLDRMRIQLQVLKDEFQPVIDKIKTDLETIKTNFKSDNVIRNIYS